MGIKEKNRRIGRIFTSIFLTKTKNVLLICGTAVDYARAVQWLEKDEEPEYAKYDLLGICYLLGARLPAEPDKGKSIIGEKQKFPL